MPRSSTMRLAEELQTVSARPDIPRPRGRTVARLILLGVPAALLAVVVGGLIYRATYQPALERGSLGGYSADSGLIELHDGIETTRLLVAKPGTPARFIYTLANRGRHAVQVRSIGTSPGDQIDGLLAITVARIGEPRSRRGDFNTWPFAPFVLAPGEERFVEVTVLSKPCAAGDRGSLATLHAFPVRYQVWGHRGEASLPLATPVLRTCGVPLKRHAYPPQG